MCNYVFCTKKNCSSPCPECGTCKSPKTMACGGCSCECSNIAESQHCTDPPRTVYYIWDDDNCQCRCPGKQGVAISDITSLFRVVANGGKIYLFNQNLVPACAGGTHDGKWCYFNCDVGDNYCQINNGFMQKAMLNAGSPIKIAYTGDSGGIRYLDVEIWETDLRENWTGRDLQFQYYGQNNNIPSEIEIPQSYRDGMRAGYGYWFYIELHDCSVPVNDNVWLWNVFKISGTGLNQGRGGSKEWGSKKKGSRIAGCGGNEKHN